MSRALVSALKDVVPADLTQIEEVGGQGMQALWNGTVVKLGRGAWLDATFSQVGLQIGDTAPMAIPASEAVREGVKTALHGLDMPAELLTGDSADAAAKFAHRLGDICVIANASPEDKLDRLTTLADNGHRVLMVGDGLNDTVALASAHASLAPAQALDVSRSAADVILLRDSFEDLPLVLKIARATQSLSKQNFAIAAVYNLIAVPIALAGFATPLAAALAMSASSITVLLNSQRIRSVK